MSREESSTSPTDKADRNPAPISSGPPRWLLIGFAVKFVLVLAIVAGVFWWANR